MSVGLLLAVIAGTALYLLHRTTFRNDETLSATERIVRDNDIYTASLLLARQYYEDIDIADANRALQQVVVVLQVRIAGQKTPAEAIACINDCLFREYRLQASDLLVVENLLPDKVLANRRGHCVGLSLLYLALAEKLGLPVFMKHVPSHAYLCYDDGSTVFNIDPTLEGAAYPDIYYASHFACPERHPVINKLNKREALGLFLNNLAHHSRQDTRALIIQNQALMLKPDCETVHTNMGVLLAGQGKTKQAAKHLEQAVRINPSSWQPYVQLAKICYHHGRYKRASECYAEAVNLLPKSFNMRVLHEHGVPGKQVLIDHARSILACEDTPRETLIGCGAALFQQGMHELSNEVFTRALVRYPENLLTHEYCALTDFHLGNYEQARQHAAIADESWGYATAYSPSVLIKTIAECYRELGLSQALLKDCDAALASIHKSIEIGGPGSNALCALAEVHLLKGNRGEAIRVFEEARDLDPSNTRIRQKLQSL